jgi:hypothetical protein
MQISQHTAGKGAAMVNLKAANDVGWQVNDGKRERLRQQDYNQLASSYRWIRIKVG